VTTKTISMPILDVLSTSSIHKDPLCIFDEFLLTSLLYYASSPNGTTCPK
jgi:hypothetical protein